MHYTVICSLDKPHYLKHLYKSPEQKAQHLDWKALNHFSHSICEDFSFIPQGSCQCFHFWGSLVSYTCPRMHASKKKSHIKVGFPIWLAQKKSPALMRRREFSLLADWHRHRPTTAIINSTDLLGNPPLTPHIELRLSEIPGHPQHLFRHISHAPPSPSQKRPGTIPASSQDMDSEGSWGLSLPSSPQQSCPFSLGHRWRTAEVRQHISGGWFPGKAW